MAKDKGPLDDQTTIDLELVAEKSVEQWLKLFKVWDGTSKLSKLDKVLRLETFFTVCFDPVRLDTFPGLEDKVIECEDGGDENPGCRGEFYSDMPRCPFCTNSESEDPPKMTQKEIAEYLIKVHDTKVSGPKKAPASPIVPKVEEKPVAQPLVKVPRQAPPDPMALTADVTAIAPQTNTTLATVEELDAAVERAVTTYASAAQNAYECAVELKEIFDRQLWRQRRGEDGQPRYKRILEFIKGELEPRGIGEQRAYGLVAMASKFSREQFEKLGPAKMTVLVSMDSTARQELAQETIEKELPLREVRERKEEIKAATGSSQKTGGGSAAKPTKREKPAVPTPPEERSFTMVFPSSSFQMVFTSSAPGRKKGKPATVIDDLPIGEFEGVNGVKLRISLKHHGAGGQITAVGTLIRDE